ncbi:replication factor A protein 1-like [Galendromus occidentalis]|uniref:Replication factor A protein 1-like n=1 Tax=Galendromus occidentalis TaxID=34638 RepID=A0AAJ6QP88_9ACAR|nr:replication factor A protein 1-like [Galendromus occidentalis]
MPKELNTPSQSKAARKRESENKAASTAKKAKLLKNLDITKLGGIVHGRVVSKSNMKNWKKNNQEGKLFSFVIEDSSGSIQVVTSGDRCDALHEEITVGDCYRLNAFTLHESNPLYNKTKHPLEIHITKLSQVKKIQGKNLPRSKINNITIAEIMNTELNTLIDIIGIVYEVGHPQNLSCRDGVMRIKQNIRLVDNTLRVVNLGVWNNAQNFAGTEGKCVAITNLLVREYAGKKVLTTTDSTILKSEPNDPDLKTLEAWFTRDGQYQEFQELAIAKPSQATTSSVPDETNHP